ncbi:MAG: hypothetical protein HRT35_08225 [Algicola sp.]|nr:hypothetical protein [Algicola sp.]
MFTQKVILLLVLCACCVACSRENEKTKNQSSDIKVFVKPRKKADNGLTFYDKARARMKAEKEVKRKEYWRKYHEYRAILHNSNYIFSQGKIRRVNNELAGSLEEMETFELIKNTYQRIRKNRHVPEGTKIIVDKSKTEYIVTFDKELPATVRGSALVAKITINILTGAIVSFEIGG